MFMNGPSGFQTIKVVLRFDRRQSRAFAGFKPQIRSKGLRDQQNVGKQNSRVKPETANRLEGRLGGQFGGVAERQEIAGLGAGFAVFGQITPGLAHHPDRRHFQCLALQGAQQ